MQRDYLTTGGDDKNTPPVLEITVVHPAWKRPSADTIGFVTFATLNWKLKFVSEISTSTSLAPPRVTAFPVAASHLGPPLSL